MSYNLLKGKRGIIFGALNEQSIAWKVAEKAVEEGASITSVSYTHLDVYKRQLLLPATCLIPFLTGCNNCPSTTIVEDIIDPAIYTSCLLYTSP